MSLLFERIREIIVRKSSRVYCLKEFAGLLFVCELASLLIKRVHEFIV